MGGPDSGGGHRQVIALRSAFIAIGLVALYLGWVGFTAYIPTRYPPPYNRWDVPYFDLQLFVLGAEPFQTGGPLPWQLETARFLAPLFTLFTVVETVRILMTEQLRRVAARWSKGHAVICGDSAFARALAGTLSARGLRVVTVTTAPTGRRHRRLLGVTGDPAQAAVLRAAAVHRCRHVYICGADDETNHAVAVATNRLLFDRPRPAWVYVQLHDYDDCQSLQARRLGAAGASRLRLDYFHVDEVAVRALYHRHPVVAAGGGPARILVVGDSTLRRLLVVETARHWAGRPDDPVPSVDVVGEGAGRELAALAARYPFLQTACRFAARDEDAQALLAAGRLDHRYDRIFLCLQDETAAVRLALTTPALWHGAPESLFVPVHLRAALAEAFHGDRNSDLLDEVNRKVLLYPVLTRACRPELITDDLTERMARRFHERFLHRQRERHREAGPALVEWDQLSETLQNANRALVQGLAATLPVLRCVIALRDGDHFQMRDDEVETLAAAEHQRWCVERAGQGWTHGPTRDYGRRSHPDLRPWDELTEESRQTTREIIRFLPDALADAGFTLVRLDEPDAT